MTTYFADPLLLHGPIAILRQSLVQSGARKNGLCFPLFLMALLKYFHGLNQISTT